MTIRFSVTIDLHGVPTVRHVRDIEESIGLAVRRLCCQRDDQLLIESRQIEVQGVADNDGIDRRPVGRESWPFVSEEQRSA